MNKEKALEFNKDCEQLIKGGIKKNCGICRELYHGTSKYIADKILKEGEIREGDRGYLGAGIYCYYFDEDASKIWARRNNIGKIAIFKLVANLGNTLFINKELYSSFEALAKEHTDFSPDINITIGYIIERVIKEFIKPKLDINIHTVAQCRIYCKSSKKKSRPEFMYSLRNKQMIKEFELHWEGR